MVTPVIPKGFMLYETEKLKTLVAVIEKLEQSNIAAEQVIEAHKKDNQTALSIIEEQDKQILLYKENEVNYVSLNKSLEDANNNYQKDIRRLNKKIKLWKNVSIAIPIVGAGVYSYFKFIK